MLSNRTTRSIGDSIASSAAAAAEGRHGRRPGADAVGPGQGQVRPERPPLALPAGVGERVVEPAGEAPPGRRRRGRCRARASAGGRSAGTRPAPAIRIANGATPAAASVSAAAATSATRASGVGPRKRRVTWRPSRRTQRTPRPSGSPARIRSTTLGDRGPGRLARAGTATNRRGSSFNAWRPAVAGRAARPATSPGRRRAPARARAASRQPTTSVSFVLEQLVGVEEVLDLDEPVRPDLVEVLDVGLVGIGDGDAQDLEVLALVVAHLEAADRAGPDAAAGEGRLVDQEEGVGVVAVAGPGVADEAVVEVVVDGRGEDAVEPEDVGRLVVLVLVPAAARDLDDDLDDRREVGARSGSSRVDRSAHRRSVAARSPARSRLDARRAHGNARRNRPPTVCDRGSDEP